MGQAVHPTGEDVGVKGLAPPTCLVASFSAGACPSGSHASQEPPASTRVCLLPSLKTAGLQPLATIASIVCFLFLNVELWVLNSGR